MRSFAWIAVVGAFAFAAPMAHAVSDEGTKAGAYNTPPGGGQMLNYQADSLDPRNCGTPDDPKPCGGMPRHPMRTYPGNRH